MDLRLVELLEKTLESGEIGSLFIGQGRRMRQVFLAGDGVHLVDVGREVRFCPLPFILDGSIIPVGELDIVLGRTGSAAEGLSKLLDDDYELTKDQRKQLIRAEMIEETLMVLEACGDRFVFEPGTVPEEVLLPSEGAAPSMGNGEFLEALLARAHELRLLRHIFPHPEEMPVMTGEGSAQRNDPRQWLFARVADLVDGFRDLRRIRKDSLFFPHLTEKLLAAGVRRGWIRKKRFPEFEGIRLDRLGADQLGVLARQLAAAIDTAVDELPLRLRLIEVLERCGDRKNVVIQLLSIGDQCVGKKAWSQAADAYRKAVSIAPVFPEATGRLAHLLEHFAAECINEGDGEAARRHLEEALPLRTFDESIQLQIIRSYGDEEQSAARAASRLSGMLHQEGSQERAIRLLRLVIDAYPTSDIIRRTYINFLLDHGMAEMALCELETLARECLARGAHAEAEQVFEKIVRLDPDRVPHQVRQKLRARKNRPAPPSPARRRQRLRGRVFRVVFGSLLAAIIGYQAWLWIEVDEFERRAFAILHEPVPLVGTQEHLDLRARWVALLEDVENIRKTHPVQLASFRIAPKIEVWQEAWQGLDRDARAHLEDLLNQARRAELAGSVDEAREIYTELARISGDLHWGQTARRKLVTLEGISTASMLIRDRADAARARGNHAQAFDLLRDLLDQFPSAEASAGVTLPVQFTSNPPGAEVQFVFRDEPSGKTPLTVELVPFTEVELILSHPDFEPLKIVIEDPRAPRVHVEFENPTEDPKRPGAETSRDSRTRPWAPLWLVQPPHWRE